MRTFLTSVVILIGVSSLLGAEPPAEKRGPIVDLDADKGIELRADGKELRNWINQVEWKAREFKATRGNGHPSLRKNVDAINGHASVVFAKQELLNDDENAFDHLVTGSGYTWFAVMAVHRQVTGEKDVNCFFGNLKNGGNYEGIWAGLTDANELWNGSRNAVTFGRYDKNNPRVLGPKLEENRWYVIAGCMASGTGTVSVELFVGGPKAVATEPFPVNPKANSSKMAIGQERDATNHPGRESFNGELARIIFWDRPLTDEELATTFGSMKKTYGVR